MFIGKPLQIPDLLMNHMQKIFQKFSCNMHTAKKYYFATPR